MDQFCGDEDEVSWDGLSGGLLLLFDPEILEEFSASQLETFAVLLVKSGFGPPELI